MPTVIKPRAVLFDVDGTLALRRPGPDTRGHFDWARVGEDIPNPAVLELAHIIGATGRYGIVVMSGRDEICRPETVDWLVRHRVHYAQLFMRPRDDFRKDSIVKAELFHTFVEPHYDVAFVVDDRDQVVKMWREMGLTCMQVAEGAF
jgi:hypothetical protein